VAGTRLLKHYLNVLRPPRGTERYSPVISAERQLGRLLEMLRWRGSYNSTIRMIADARWARQTPDFVKASCPKTPSRSDAFEGSQGS